MGIIEINQCQFMPCDISEWFHSYALVDLKGWKEKSAFFFDADSIIET